MKRVLNVWVLAVILITAFYFTIYATVQQTYRMGANDPQIQISEDTASIFTGSTEAQSLVPTEKIDVKTSLSTFGIIYDTSGKVLASSADLNGKTPDLPAGAIDKARIADQNRITWQPEKGVRLAVVITKAQKGYVLIGRNMREVEKRITNLGYMVLAAWVGTMILLLAYWSASALVAQKTTKKA